MSFLGAQGGLSVSLKRPPKHSHGGSGAQEMCSVMWRPGHDVEVQVRFSHSLSSGAMEEMLQKPTKNHGSGGIIFQNGPHEE